MGVPEKIKYLKKLQELTNDDLAERSGVPLGTVNKIASGYTLNPSKKTLGKIAAALGKSIEYFLDDSIPPDEGKSRDGSENGLYQILLRIMDVKGISYYHLSMMCDIPAIELRNIVQWKEMETTTGNAVKLARGLGLSLEQITGLAPIDYGSFAPVDTKEIESDVRLFELLRTNGFIKEVNIPTDEQMNFIRGIVAGINLIFNK